MKEIKCYKAEDDSVFETEEECLQYESKLKIFNKIQPEDEENIFAYLYSEYKSASEKFDLTLAQAYKVFKDIKPEILDIMKDQVVGSIFSRSDVETDTEAELKNKMKKVSKAVTKALENAFSKVDFEDGKVLGLACECNEASSNYSNKDVKIYCFTKADVASLIEEEKEKYLEEVEESLAMLS